MKAWIPTREEWSQWGKLERCGYASFIIGVIALVLTALSFVDVSKTNKGVTDIKEQLKSSPASEVHIFPGDIEFDLDFYREKTSVALNASIIFQARKAPILMKKKADLIDFKFDEQHFSYQDFDRKLELKKVTVNKISLEKISESAVIELEFDTMFVYVKANDIVWNIEDIRGEVVGEAKVRLYYVFDDREKSIDITIPIRFV
ncbi:hypothetical protein L3I75_004356 [Vibrio vulnificus]|nr:hypothetical protein [Vibrio vulnificus]EIU7865155.1 hypothetical protein [Vibrio vulnificus]EJE8581573.1 hypothetical protein [Vibrio vulnificus]